MCHISRACTLETHARQLFSGVGSTFPCIKITRAKESMLGQSDFCLFASQGVLSLMVLWCDDSKPKRPGLS